jgi:hypothetical protein
MKNFVKPNYKGKKVEKIIMDAASKGELTAYIKHSPSGAMIPVTTEAIDRLKNGETLGIEEAERTYDRFYFKLPFLAIRWGMENKECLDKLIDLDVPCFFNPEQVPISENKATVGQDDVCVFKEYVDALEKTIIKKKKDVQPEFVRYGCR